MKTTKHNLTNSLSPRAIQMVTVTLTLIVWASWIAPTGHTSNQQVSATNGSPSPRTTEMNVRTRSASSQINQVTVAGANVWTTNGPSGISISSLAIDQINPAILFAKGEGRLYKSTDGGASWASLSTPGAYVSAFAIDPRNSNIVYAGFPPDDRDCLPGSFGGIAKSTDGGETWSLPIIGIGDVSTFAVDPSNSDIVY